jgi:hypothetical protein
MEQKINRIISKELEQFHCSILLDEVREKVRKLKAFTKLPFPQALWNDIVLENWEGLFNFATKRKNIWKELR